MFMYRDSNPGPIFSIPGFGIETFLIPGARRDCVMTIKPLPRISHRPQFTHKSGHGLVGNVVLLMQNKLNNVQIMQRTACRLHCSYIGLMVRVQFTYK
jgi:hypothetical protein